MRRHRVSNSQVEVEDIEEQETRETLLDPFPEPAEPRPEANANQGPTTIYTGGAYGLVQEAFNQVEATAIKANREGKTQIRLKGYISGLPVSVGLPYTWAQPGDQRPDWQRTDPMQRQRDIA
jgi:hypothetical protein